MLQPVKMTLPEPPAKTSLLSKLAATALPEADTPLLEERNPSEPTPAADTSLDKFTPAEPEMLAAADKAENKMQESAVKNTLAVTKVTEMQVLEPLANALKESAMETPAAESELADTPAEVPALEPMALDALPELAMTKPAKIALEELDGAAAVAADTSADIFSPNAVATKVGSQARGEVVADNAMSDAAEAGAVAVAEAGTTGAKSAIEGAMSKMGAAASSSDLPPAELAVTMPGGGLPEPALENLGAPPLQCRPLSRLSLAMHCHHRQWIPHR